MPRGAVDEALITDEGTIDRKLFGKDYLHRETVYP
jgi:hypothetical protein